MSSSIVLSEFSKILLNELQIHIGWIGFYKAYISLKGGVRD